MKTLKGFIVGSVLVLGAVLLLWPPATAELPPAGWQAAVNDLQGQVDALAAASVPAGTVVPFAGPGGSVPAGFLLADGSAVDRTTFADLFAVIGTSHGVGDGSTTFNLPDYRGRFLRGVDQGTARDPNAATRDEMDAAQTGNSGDAVGSVQGDATALPNTSFGTSSPGNHNHSINDKVRTIFTRELVVSGLASEKNIVSGGTTTTGNSTAFTGSHTHSITTGGDLETRPTNAYVNWIIKT